MDYFHLLNSIYIPVCDKASELNQGLEKAGYPASMQFYNNHSIKRNGVFVTEFYPIPVISIKDIGDVGINFDSVWFEIVLPKDTAIKLNYAEISSKHKIEVYGTNDFLHDFFNETIDVSDVVSNISNSSEADVCILFYLSKDTVCGQLLEIIRLFK